MAVHPWPNVPEEQRWAIEAMEERLANTNRPPEALAARARELRDEAETSEIKGERDAASALAGHYEGAAAGRAGGAPS
jgi:hypothetical protein